MYHDMFYLRKIMFDTIMDFLRYVMRFLQSNCSVCLNFNIIADKLIKNGFAVNLAFVTAELLANECY